MANYETKKNTIILFEIVIGSFVSFTPSSWRLEITDIYIEDLT